MNVLYNGLRCQDEAHCSEPRSSAALLLCTASIAALLVMCVPLSAQVRFGSVVGSVTDSTGATVPEATVTLTNLGTSEKRTTHTEQNGNFTFPNVGSGRYSVDIEKPGFKHFSRSPLEVQVDVSSRVDAALEVGAATETVEVTGEGPVLQTDSSSLGQVVSENQVAATPLAGRNVNNLLTLVPGVVAGGSTYGNIVGNQAGGARTNSIAFGNYAIGGGFANQSAFFIDGVASNGPANNANSLIPSQDSVQEFRIATNNVSAEYGSYAGGVINITTRSGTNQFHGSAYDYLRNKVLNANDFFSRINHIDRAPLRQNQFGGKLGGPILKNKSFFFFNYEGLRNHSGVLSSTTVPTAAMLNGDFSAAGFPKIYDPTTGTQFSCNGVLNVICPNRINASALAILKTDYPTGSPSVATLQKLPSSFGLNNYVFRFPTNGVQDQYTARVDHTFSSRDNLFGRYTYWKVISSPYDAWGTHTQGQGRTGLYSQQAVLGNTYTINPKTMLDVRASYVRIFQNESPDSAGTDLSQFGNAWGALSSSLLGTTLKPNVAFTTSGAGIAGLGITAANGQGSQLYWHQNVYALTGSVTKIMGSHTLKFGGTQRKIEWFTQGNNQSIAFTFDNQYTSNPTVAGSGYAVASALLGTPAQTAVTNVAPVHAFYYQYGFFVEDTYQFSRKLTLNLGIRWDQPSIYSEARDSDTVFLPNAAAPVIGNGKTVSSIVNPATGGSVPLVGLATLVNSPAWKSHREDNLHWKMFAPRVGFAYRITDKTVVRAGYGLSFLPPTLAQDGPAASQINSTSTLINNTFGATPAITSTTSNPFPSGIQLPPSRKINFNNFLGTVIASRVPGDPQAYAQQWNLAVERQIGNNGALMVAYAGSKGAHLLLEGAATFSNININQVPDQYLSLGQAKLNAPVANPFFGIVTDPTNPLSKATIPTYQLLKPFPQYDRVQAVDPHLGYSSYNALQTSFRERVGFGFATVAYTWSKLMSNTDAVTNFLDENSSGAVDGVIQDNTIVGLDRSISAYDITQNLTFGYSVDLPFGHNKRFLKDATGVVNALVGGWRFNGITSIRSGPPLAPLQTGSILQQNLGVANGFIGRTSRNIRPDWVPGCDPRVSGGAVNRLNQWFNTSCFALVPTGASDPVRFGTAARVISSIRVDGTNNWDLSLVKELPITERVNLQFTTESFNLFNKSRFAGPAVNKANSNFGVVSATAGQPRQLQFGLRLSF